MTTFTDDDLAGLRKYLGFRQKPTDRMMLDCELVENVLARLDAAEACIEQAKGMGLICCEDVCCEGEPYSRWRKVCGK